MTKIRITTNSPDFEDGIDYAEPFKGINHLVLNTIQVSASHQTKIAEIIDGDLVVHATIISGEITIKEVGHNKWLIKAIPESVIEIDVQERELDRFQKYGQLPRGIAKLEIIQDTPAQQQQAKPRISIPKRTDRRSIMQAAWAIARAAAAKFGGKVKEFFALSLKQAWAIAI